MSEGIKGVALRDLPYLSAMPEEPRKLPLTGYHDGEVFCVYQTWPGGPAELFEMRPLGFLWGEYLAERPADPSLDLPSPLGTAVYRHYSAKGVIRAYVDLAHDLDGILAPIRTLLVLAERENRERDPSSSWQVGHLIEGAIGLHRSAYDLMHRVVMRVSALSDPTAPQLKDSFSKLALKDRAHLVGPLALPETVADFYLARAEVFAATRDVRDLVFHHGHSPEHVFHFEDGFGLALRGTIAEKLSALDVWAPDRQKPNAIGSVLELLAFLADDLNEATAALAGALVAGYPPEADVVHGTLYRRTPPGVYGHALGRYREAPWVDIAAEVNLVRDDTPES
ncbi:MAG: hypothetical protein SangKO_098980 [Sandaracinaceae bacterium]